MVKLSPNILCKSLLLGLACSSFSSYAAQYIIKLSEVIPEQESSEWVSLPPLTTEWAKDPELRNCEQWSPSADGFLVGEPINQTRNCDVAYTRTITEQEQNSVTGEIRVAAEYEDSKIDSELFTQKAIGLNNIITGRALASNQEINTHGVPCSEIPADKRDWIIESNFVLSKESSVVTCGKVRFTFQNDGNLVLYTPSGARWWTGSNNVDAGRFVFQSDGNLVVYAASTPSSALWHSHTYMYPNSTLRISNAGGISLKSNDGAVVWSK